MEGPSPAAAAAPAPALEPPDVIALFQGLRVLRERTVARALPSELRRRGLAEHDPARRPQARDERRVHVGHAGGEDVRAGHRADAPGQREVLDRVRNAMERAERIAAHHGVSARRAREGQLRRRRAEGVERGVQRVDAREHGSRQLDGRERARPDQRAKLGG